MEYIGGIENFSYKPISGYNSFLKGNASFDVNTDTEFDAVLNKQQIKAADSGTMGDFMSKVGKAFGGGLNSVNDMKMASDRAQEALAMGEDVSVHDVMIAAEKSSLSMNMALQLRNKILTAYQEINNVKV